MGNRFLNFISRGLLKFLLVFTFFSCDNDTETIYEGYGLVNKSEHGFSVTLDDGNLIYPKESFIDPSRLNDSTRLYMQFNIMEEKDSCAYVRLTYADTILTKSVLPYSESILDSVGKAPIQITQAWVAHNFLNFEFMFAGSANVNFNQKHMINLLQHPSAKDQLNFEFRHNDFNDRPDKIYIGVVSFRLGQLIEDSDKPIKMTIKYNDTKTSTRSIRLIYQ